MVLRVVYENGNFLGSNLPCSVAKHKQHGVNHIGLATAIGAHYGAKALHVLCVCVCVCVCVDNMFITCGLSFTKPLVPLQAMPINPQLNYNGHQGTLAARQALQMKQLALVAEVISHIFTT